jgi:ABC-type antimicrobial peptide transport system permease subunit
VSDLTLHVRVRASAQQAAVLAGIRREVQTLDPSLPLYNVGTLAEQKDGSLYTQRVAAALLAVFGGLAAALAGIGIYGVLSFGVTERTREIGIRMSQGAQAHDVLAMFLRQGMLLTVIGVIVGLGLSVLLTRTIRGFLFGVGPNDPAIFILVPVGFVLVALLACWFPARRATRLSPLVALRYE